jgi:hypothetical protein
MERSESHQTLVSQLRDSDEELRKFAVAKEYQTVMQTADAIPLRTKTQYPIYIEARMLHILRSIAGIDSVSVQETIRILLQEGIDRRVRAPNKKKGGRRKKTGRK